MSPELSIVPKLRGPAAWAALVLFLALAAIPVAAQEAAPGPAPAAQEHGAQPGVVQEIEQAEADLEGAEEEHGAGMPQLDSSTFLSQIFWLVLTFGLLFWLLKTKALPKVSEVLEARQDRIAGDLDRAATLRAEAEAAARKQEQVVAQAHARAQTRLKELQDRLAADAAKRQAALDAELGAKLGAAEARVRAAREAALAEVRGVAVEAAQAAAQRLAGLEVGRETAEAALDTVVREAA
jgi:F-type H+-transporting ATPase subunit b